MKKYFITDRPSGLGDVLCNLAATYFFAKKYNGDVILDWRYNMYNKNINYNFKTDNLPNLFNSIFLQPSSINNVNFILPESNDSYYYNKFEFSNLSPNFKTLPESEVELLKNDLISKINCYQYIKVEQRICENNQVFKELLFGKFKIKDDSNTTLEDFNFDNFLKNFKIQPILEEKINKFYETYFKNNLVVGIHMRYGNLKLKEPYFRLFPSENEPWVDDDTLIDTIKKAISKFDLQNAKYFISCDNDRINDLIVSNIPNSFCYKKTFPEKDGCIHLNNEGYPIQMIQESFIDMFLLKMCDYLVATAHSVFTVWPIFVISKESTDFSKIQIIFNDRTK